MKSSIVIFSLLLICMAGGCSDGKPGKLAKDAYLSLKKIEAKTETGVTYPEYVQAVGEAKYTVNIFTENKGDKDFPNNLIKFSILEVMQKYLVVGAIWSNKIQSGSSVIHADSNLYHMIAESCPKIKEDAMSINSWHYGFIEGDEAMKTLWKDASSDLKKISIHFK